MFENVNENRQFLKTQFLKKHFVNLIFTVYAKLSGIKQQPFNYDYKVSRSGICKGTGGLILFAFQCLGTQLERLKWWAALTAVCSCHFKDVIFIHKCGNWDFWPENWNMVSPCSLDSSWHGGLVMTENHRGASVSRELSGSCLTFSDQDLKPHSDHSVVLSWVRVVTMLSDSREGDIDPTCLCKKS